MRLKALGEWFDQRLKLGTTIREVATHHVPRSTASWCYVFGSAALTLFIIQVVTGILLAITYVPSAAEAWNSLQTLNHGLTLGWFLRGMHGWGSNFMVVVVCIHMAQVFLFGAYKYPRELTWILGVFLLICTLGMAFTGQVLRFDQDAYWGLGIGVAIMGRVPLLRDDLQRGAGCAVGRRNIERADPKVTADVQMDSCLVAGDRGPYCRMLVVRVTGRSRQDFVSIYLSASYFSPDAQGR